MIALVVTAPSRSHFAVGQNPRARLVHRYIHTARWVMSGGKREPEYEIGGMPAANDVHLHPASRPTYKPRRSTADMARTAGTACRARTSLLSIWSLSPLDGSELYVSLDRTGGFHGQEAAQP